MINHFDQLYTKYVKGDNTGLGRGAEEILTLIRLVEVIIDRIESNGAKGLNRVISDLHNKLVVLESHLSRYLAQSLNSCSDFDRLSQHHTNSSRSKSPRSPRTRSPRQPKTPPKQLGQSAPVQSKYMSTDKYGLPLTSHFSPVLPQPKETIALEPQWMSTKFMDVTLPRLIQGETGHRPSIHKDTAYTPTGSRKPSLKGDSGVSPVQRMRRKFNQLRIMEKFLLTSQREARESMVQMDTSDLMQKIDTVEKGLQGVKEIRGWNK